MNRDKGQVSLRIIIYFFIIKTHFNTVLTLKDLGHTLSKDS